MSQILDADPVEIENTVPSSAAPSSDAVDEFPMAIRLLAEQHRPSRMPFFRNLAALDRAAASDPSFLGQIHLVYQAAMHATRAAVYYLPHLDSPALRKRKLQIFVDDDGLPGGDTHHYQLTRAFRNIGAKCVLDDEAFARARGIVPPSRRRSGAIRPPRRNASIRARSALVRGRGDVGRLDARARRCFVGAFPAICRRAVFCGVLLRDGRRAPCRGVVVGHPDGPESAAGTAARNDRGRQDHGRGARRGMDPSRPNCADRRSVEPIIAIRPAL